MTKQKWLQLLIWLLGEIIRRLVDESTRLRNVAMR